MKALERSNMWGPKIDKILRICYTLVPFVKQHRMHPQRFPINHGPGPIPLESAFISNISDHSGERFLFIVDAHSNWIEELPTRISCTSATSISKLQSVIAAFGIPEMFVSDNGPVFTSLKFMEFVEKNGIRAPDNSTISRNLKWTCWACKAPVNRGFVKQTQVAWRS